MKGCVFDIQRSSVHDGPGIRTTVFLKGCNLKCFWCQNPESIDRCPEIEEFEDKCIGCGKCIDACPVSAVRIEDGKKVFRRELCERCGKCAESCYSGARVLLGKMMTVEGVLETVERDRPFYIRSGGGVTFSGGEPMLQIGFLREALKECKKREFHTAVDTAGNVPWSSFLTVIPYTDLFLYDMKVMDEKKHKEATGVSNKRILENLSKLADSDKDILIRIPVIPGFNDTEEDMHQSAAFLSGLSRKIPVELLPFHQLGSGKYDIIGKEYKAKDLMPLDRNVAVKLSEVFSREEIPVKVS